MRKITWAMLGWTVLWIVDIWALDPASTVGGAKPPAWVLFELWATGFVLLGAVWSNVLTNNGAGATPGRVRIDARPMRSMPGAVLVWTVLWMVLFGIWALDPDPSSIGQGPGSGGLLRLKSPEWVLFDLWATGLVLLGAAWLATRLWNARRRGS